ncbi:MAG: hypothetical protein HYX82_05660 [Chloroflexi bacterium]|nr:hypothetical protein [Chloroflexota bacterium]
MGSWQGLPPTSRDINYEKVLKKGLVGVVEEAREELLRLSRFDTEEDVKKFHFLEAVIIALEAVISYANRHARLARELAAREQNPVRKVELERIAEICEWVPKNPPRSFYEAVQSFWLLLLALNQETASQGETPGRFDQYIYPFYEKDIREGKLTRQEAAEILGCLWVKFLEMEMVKEATLKSKTQGSHIMNLTIGGVNKAGEDATNELSYLILDVVRQIKPHQPHLTVRYHDGLSEAFLIKAVETNREVHGGMPQWVNDKIVILNLVSMGVPLEEARDWEAISCSYYNIPHAAGQYGKPVQINQAKVFEIALNNGVDPRTGKRLGIETGDPRSFSSWEEVYDAFKKQLKYVVNTVAKAGRLGTVVRGENYALPFNSALMDDCIKTGKDVMDGGMRYKELVCTGSDRGHVDVANSLAAIKKLVFEEKKITMAELLDALASDFEGKEGLRQILLSAPKWGNDDDYVDSIMKDVWLWTAKTLMEETNVWGKPITPGRFGIAWHYWAGKATGALPTGRRAYTPLTDGAVSPMPGTDKKGPTAVINSASKLDFTVVTDAVLNQKFPPALLQTREGIRKLLALIKSFFDRYGYHIQFNIIDRATLLDAQKHPELYRDLVIRVAGYSAYFVELARDLQDEIISRTEQTL